MDWTLGVLAAVLEHHRSQGSWRQRREQDAAISIASDLAHHAALGLWQRHRHLSYLEARTIQVDERDHLLHAPPPPEYVTPAPAPLRHRYLRHNHVAGNLLFQYLMI